MRSAQHTACGTGLAASDGWLLPEPTGIVLNGALTMMNMSIVALVCYAVRRMWRRGGAQPRVALIVLREVMLIFSLIAIYAYMSGQAIIAQDGSAEGFVQYLTEYSAIVLLCMPLLCVIASYIIQDVRYLHQRRLNRLYEYQQEAYEAALGSQQRFRHNIVNSSMAWKAPSTARTRKRYAVTTNSSWRNARWRTTTMCWHCAA